MSAKTEVENMKTSGPEKVLAVALTVFILIGAVWMYSQIGKISDETYSWDYEGYQGARIELSQHDRAAIREQREARSSYWKTRQRLKRAEDRVAFTGDAYRTEREAGLSGTAELAAYRQAQERLAKARKANRAADARFEASRPAAKRAEANRTAAWDDKRAEQRRDDRWVAVLRLALVGSMLSLGYWSLSIARRRRSRLLPLALAWITASAVLSAWMALDYGLQTGVFREIGPLLISLVGIVLTVFAFVSLQRYLARKIPQRRLRRRECPFCGFPAHDSPNCEGCGRRLVGECPTCHQARRVGAPHCGNCGSS